MKNILIIQPIDKSGIEILENRPDYNFEIIDGTDLEQIKEKIVKCDGISIRTAKLPADVIRSAKNLKIISEVLETTKVKLKYNSKLFFKKF